MRRSVCCLFLLTTVCLELVRQSACVAALTLAVLIRPTHLTTCTLPGVGFLGSEAAAIFPRLASSGYTLRPAVVAAVIAGCPSQIGSQTASFLLPSFVQPFAPRLARLTLPHASVCSSEKEDREYHGQVQ